MSTPDAPNPPDAASAPDDMSVPAETSASAASAPGLDAQLRDLAVKRLKKRQDFHAHVVVYAVVNGFLWALWLVISLTSGWHFPWPVFPLLGWGIGLALNAWDVYGRREITAADIEREVERLRRG